MAQDCYADIHGADGRATTRMTMAKLCVASEAFWRTISSPSGIQLCTPAMLGGRESMLYRLSSFSRSLTAIIALPSRFSPHSER